jgi:hypothetical protein
MIAMPEVSIGASCGVDLLTIGAAFGVPSAGADRLSGAHLREILMHRGAGVELGPLSGLPVLGTSGRSIHPSTTAVGEALRPALLVIHAPLHRRHLLCHLVSSFVTKPSKMPPPKVVSKAPAVVGKSAEGVAPVT